MSQALGRSLADRYIASRPDLVALRPLVARVASSVAGSSTLSGPTRSAADIGDLQEVVRRLNGVG